MLEQTHPEAVAEMDAFVSARFETDEAGRKIGKLTRVVCYDPNEPRQLMRVADTLNHVVNSPCAIPIASGAAAGLTAAPYCIE